jgi:phospho-N-acetylmuramoyl-pentapeptide-transferase
MVYYLANLLLPQMNALNVFTYHTVRAGGAALTGFLFCVLMGPRIIALLRQFKVGQHIKQDHVADLHALHKGKAGTPTMGGAMIIFSTVLSLLLWSTLTNRLLWVALGVFVLLGAVGFVDDYIKMKRKHNDGLSARAKLIGQLLAGTILGVYVVLNPITVSPATIYERQVNDFNAMRTQLAEAATETSTTPAARLWERLPQGTKTLLQNRPINSAVDHGILVQGLNALLDDPSLYSADHWSQASMSEELNTLVRSDLQELSDREKRRKNRLLIEAALPGLITPSLPSPQTQVGVPGFKNLFIPFLAPLYVLFVILIIVSVSNAVNLTDGLDGLAAGASIISILTFAAIAYVISRADWSQYLYLIYIPEASELFVFGGALLGTGLGFLWFNAHPAEVFMGDTGSLALGGAIGTLAVLTKQELLLPIVAGLFVLEALSVVIQVGSFKLTGKRVFRMAPLHHHFELLGWSETKVTLRFWIIAFLFAMMSLGTLKLR